MKKQLALTMLLVAAFAAAPALAKKPETPPAEKSAAAAEKQVEMTQERFERQKEMMLKRAQSHIARLQEQQKCLEAATTPDALRECRPYGKTGGHRMGGPEGKSGGKGKGPAPKSEKK